MPPRDKVRPRKAQLTEVTALATAKSTRGHLPGRFYFLNRAEKHSDAREQKSEPPGFPSANLSRQNTSDLLSAGISCDLQFSVLG